MTKIPFWQIFLFKVMLHLIFPLLFYKENDCENGTANLYDQDGDGVKIVRMIAMMKMPISLPIKSKSVMK